METRKDGSSLLGLATWLDEIDGDLIDLTKRIQLSKMNEGEVYHSARTRALGAALDKIGDTLGSLLSVLPTGKSNEKTQLLCMGLISHWLDRESQARASADSGMRGNIASFPISNVLEFISAQRKSGLLRVLAPDETFFLGFADGDVVHAASDNAPEGERLGEVLVEMGKITKSQLRMVVGGTNKQRLRLGIVLLEKGYVDADALRSALEVQVRRIFARLFECAEAQFEFHEEAAHRQSTKIRLPTRTLLFECARTKDEAQRDRDAAIAAVGPDSDQPADV